MKVKERKPVKDSKIVKLLNRLNLKQITVHYEGGFLTEADIKAGSLGSHTSNYEDGIELSDDDDFMLKNHIEFKILDKLFPRWDGGTINTGSKIVVEITVEDSLYINYHINHTKICMVTSANSKGKIVSGSQAFTTSFVY